MPNPMLWLEAGMPLTLLIDLLDTRGPASPRIYAEEPPDSTWLPRAAGE
jgi:hypothetical protein